MFDPVVEWTARSTEVITKEMIPMREEMKSLNEKYVNKKQHIR